MVKNLLNIINKDIDEIFNHYGDKKSYYEQKNENKNTMYIKKADSETNNYINIMKESSKEEDTEKETLPPISFNNVNNSLMTILNNGEQNAKKDLKLIKLNKDNEKDNKNNSTFVSNVLYFIENKIEYYSDDNEY